MGFIRPPKKQDNYLLMNIIVWIIAIGMFLFAVKLLSIIF